MALALPRLVPIVSPKRAMFAVGDDSDRLDSAPLFRVDWPTDVARPRVGIVQDIDVKPYWTKYRRFLEANAFSFELLDIHADDWMDSLEVDVIVWRPSSQLYELEEARRKIFFLHDFLGIQTYPSLRTVNLYEDKVLQCWALRSLGADIPETIVSYSEEDALARLPHLGSEIVWKLTTGSGSFGVERMSQSRARTAIRKVFSASGRLTYWPYARQKGYMYAQRLEQDLRTDARVIVVGPLLFGYYRDAPKGDFRASGMGLERKESFPAALLEEAWTTARGLGIGAVAMDFIVDKDFRRWKVIEFSSFIQVNNAEELMVDGQPGVYIRRAPGVFDFQPGRFWLQELALAEALGRLAGLDADELLLGSVERTTTKETPVCG